MTDRAGGLTVRSTIGVAELGGSSSDTDCLPLALAIGLLGVATTVGVATIVGVAFVVGVVGFLLLERR